MDTQQLPLSLTRSSRESIYSQGCHERLSNLQPALGSEPEIPPAQEDGLKGGSSGAAPPQEPQGTPLSLQTLRSRANLPLVQTPGGQPGDPSLARTIRSAPENMLL